MKPLDEAQLKAEFREHYRRFGYTGCLQIMYELLESIIFLCDIMREEVEKEKI